MRTWRADGAIVTEPTELAIAAGHKGFAWVGITVEGKAAHGSRPAEGQDAILRLGRVLNRLEALDRALQAQPPHPLVGTGSLHASIVAGGRELSSYPDRATLQMERRILPSEPESTAIDEVREILDALRREDATFRGSAEALFSRPAYEVPPDHALPRALRRPWRGQENAAHHRRELLDRRRRPRHAGIPSILFGRAARGSIRSRNTSTWRRHHLPRRASGTGRGWIEDRVIELGNWIVQSGNWIPISNTRFPIIQLPDRVKRCGALRRGAAV